MLDMCWIYHTNTISLLRITHVRDIYSITSSIFNWQGSMREHNLVTPLPYFLQHLYEER